MKNMKKNTQLLPEELEIMKVVWQAEKPLTYDEIKEELVKRDFQKLGSFLRYISKLRHLRLLVPSGVKAESQSYPPPLLWVAGMTQGEFQAWQYRMNYHDYKDKHCLPDFISAMFRTKDDKEDWDEIFKALQDTIDNLKDTDN